MKFSMLNILFIILFSISVKSQYLHGTIDTVISYHWGNGQNSGQSAEFFPQNIFGSPDTSAREDFQSADPYQICSLGLGGEIIVGFLGMDIVDGPGPDFTIFENAFFNPVTSRIFVEPAQISVSEDGIVWIAFPFDSLSLKGCAGVTPTHGNEDPFNPAVSGGDKFDLSDIGLNKVRYIKIKDTCRLLLNNPKLPFYDPIITGFDLDAVVGLNLKKHIETTDINDVNPGMAVINKHGVIIIQSTKAVQAELFSVIGEQVYKGASSGDLYIPTQQMSQGVYILRIVEGNEILIKKIII
jgi:hypothetical protein